MPYLSTCPVRRRLSLFHNVSWRLALLLLSTALGAQAQKFYTYIEDLGPDYVEVAWGAVDGVNTIGRTSASHGPATIKIAGRTANSRSNYVTIGSLEPDHDYTYEVTIGP